MQCEKFCSYLQEECVGKGVGLEEERPQEQIWPSTVHNGQQLDTRKNSELGLHRFVLSSTIFNWSWLEEIEKVTEIVSSREEGGVEGVLVNVCFGKWQVVKDKGQAIMSNLDSVNFLLSTK